MTRLVCIGECMVEMAPDGAGGYNLGFAGDTMNTAWYLRKLLPSDVTVDYLTAVGTDALSDQMLGFLRDAGLGTDHVQRRDDSTVGLYLIHLDHGERSFSYWRGQSAARRLAQHQAPLATALAGAQLAVFSGITLAILPAAERRFLLEALRRFRAQGGRVAFDPNLRPRLWSHPDEMRDWIMQGAGVSDIVLPSFEDETGAFGDLDVQATAKRYARAGARIVVVKNGAAPVSTWEHGALQTHPLRPVAHVTDTTAAGDSFNAGFLAPYLAGQDTAFAVQQGCALAARVVQSPGALVP